jgi:hypothetical protein
MTMTMETTIARIQPEVVVAVVVVSLIPEAVKVVVARQLVAVVVEALHPLRRR